MGAFDLIGKAVKGAKKAAPFFSKADEVLDDLPRNKGLGNEFLAELVKKGAKPTELKDRGIDKALKDKPKMTKAEVQEIFEQKAPPKVQEQVLGGKHYRDALDQQAKNIIGDLNVTFDDLYGSDRTMARANVDRDLGYAAETKYEKYRTQGGENYREILLKLPKRGLNEGQERNLMLLEHDLSRGKELSSTQQARYAELKERESAQNYYSSHFDEVPNILAHIRVQDFTVPSKGYAVVNTRSGNKSEVFPTIEDAHAAMFQYPENMRSQLRLAPAEGKPKKVLLVDEIQSDMHQEGRKKGYKSPTERTAAQAEKELYKVIEKRERLLGEATALPNTEMARFIKTNEEINLLGERAMQLGQEMRDLASKPNGVPDAPFKKNWHELSMKRVLDYAAENGYDSVAITPGAEQAKRYDLSKQVDELLYNRNDDGTYRILARTGEGDRIIEESLAAEKLENYVGREITQKIIGGEGAEAQASRFNPRTQSMQEDAMQSLSGVDLQVGGEGMKGFYDKILPDYLNNYGKQYGAQVREIQLEAGKKIHRGPSFLRSEHPNMQSFHALDITPQMREAIQTKGQPMYGKVAMPALEGMAAGAGAAAAGSQIFEEDNEQTVQNPIEFTQNPDTMLLELMQRE